MRQDMSAASRIREWMLLVLKERDWTPAYWAKLSGLAPSTVQKAIKPSYEFVTSSRTLEKLASTAGTSPPTVNSPMTRSSRIQPLFLPVRHKVRAGLWLEVDELMDESYGERPVAPDPRYSDFPQWLELVEGDSCDRRITEGGYARVVDAVAMGYAPAPGDFVIVERRRDQGGLRERTLKQVQSVNGRAVLVGCSSNDRWNAPIALDDDAEAEVEIVGKVLGAYYDF